MDEPLAFHVCPVLGKCPAFEIMSSEEIVDNTLHNGEFPSGE